MKLSADKIRRLPRKLRYAISMQRWNYTPPPKIPENPPSAKRKVIFYSISPTGFGGPGKMDAYGFLPEFCEMLQSLNYSCHLPHKYEDFCRLIDSDSIVALIYNETRGHFIEWGLESQLSKAAGVFHYPEQSYLVRSKAKLSNKLAEANIPSPRMIESDVADCLVFSNEISSSGAAVQVLSPGEKLDRSRFNTEYINSVFSYKGEDFHIMVRIMCIGAQIVMPIIKLRPVSENSPSVHTGDTPVNAELLNAAYKEIVEPRLSLLNEIAEQMDEELGLGFWAHDLVFDATKDQFLVCETGYKFVDDTALNRLNYIKQELWEPELFDNRGYSKKAAYAFDQAVSNL